MYLVYDAASRDAVIIDTGGQVQAMEDMVESEGLNVVAIFNTHGHFDHSDANHYYGERYSCKVYGSRGEEYNYQRNEIASFPDVYFDDGDVMRAGVFTVRVIQTAGHSRGSSNLLIEMEGGAMLFTGDNLFKRKVGPTWPDDQLSARQKQQMLIDGIKEKLLCLDDGLVIYPGHGPSTTIGQERQNNRYLRK